MTAHTILSGYARIKGQVLPERHRRPKRASRRQEVAA